MEENYINLLKNFKELDEIDKKNEILKKTYELIKLLYYENKKIDNSNSALGILSSFNDDDEYYNLLFSYIMTLREESAKIIEKLENMQL